MKEIRCLPQKEKENTRAMYAEIFREDSEDFVNYYYEWKTQDNEILVMEEEEGYQVMLHLNPYTLSIHGTEAESRYIVAVATRSQYRGKGKMCMVMQQAFQLIYHRQMPLTFLLPADPAYYRGQGFVYFPCQPKFGKSPQRTGGAQNGCDKKRISRVPFTAKKAGLTELTKLASFSNEILHKQYDIFIKREEEYYRRLLAETACLGGGVLWVKSGESPVGILSYGMEETAEGLNIEVRELILAEEYQKETEAVLKACFPKGRVQFANMCMMVRIVNLQKLGTLLRSSRTFSQKVQIQDCLIEENNGCFLIRIDQDKGSIVPIPNCEVQQAVDISKLTEILFCNSGVFLNEWV